MNSRIRLTLTAAAVAAALFAVAFVPDPATADFNAFEREVVRIVNEHRANLGLPALSTDVRLFDAAEGHAEWMGENQTLSHTGEGGSGPGDRALAEGYPWTALGEVIAQGYPSPSAVVSGWMNSPPHRAILMSSAYKDIGVGYVESDGPLLHWWVGLVGNCACASQPIPGEVEPSPTMTVDITATLTALPTRLPPTATETQPPTELPTELPTRILPTDPVPTELPTRILPTIAPPTELPTRIFPTPVVTPTTPSPAINPTSESTPTRQPPGVNPTPTRPSPAINPTSTPSPTRPSPAINPTATETPIAKPTDDGGG
jgi:uncharacterized protein YkwD